MKKIYFDDKNSRGVDYSVENLIEGDYNNCTFTACNFSNTNLSGINFEDCRFDNCDLSNAKTAKTAFQNISFKNCKILGLHFDECNSFLLSFSFENCQLNLSSFYQLKIKSTKFKNCILHEVDFTETDLTASEFENCDLMGAIFGYTILEKVDFSTSVNFSIDPDLNRIKKAKFSMQGLTGLLDKYDIQIL